MLKGLILGAFLIAGAPLMTATTSLAGVLGPSTSPLVDLPANPFIIKVEGEWDSKWPAMGGTPIPHWSDEDNQRHYSYRNGRYRYYRNGSFYAEPALTAPVNGSKAARSSKQRSGK